MQPNLNNLASLCDCHGTYFTDLDRHSLVCAYVLAVKHATLTTAINLKIALNNATSQRLATRRNELEQLGKLITLPVWSTAIQATIPERINDMFSDNDLYNETPAQLYDRVHADYMAIGTDTSLPLHVRQRELMWRQEFMLELIPRF